MLHVLARPLLLVGPVVKRSSECFLRDVITPTISWDESSSHTRIMLVRFRFSLFPCKKENLFFTTCRIFPSSLFFHRKIAQSSSTVFWVVLCWVSFLLGSNSNGNANEAGLRLGTWTFDDYKASFRCTSPLHKHDDNPTRHWAAELSVASLLGNRDTAWIGMTEKGRRGERRSIRSFP